MKRHGRKTCIHSIDIVMRKVEEGPLKGHWLLTELGPDGSGCETFRTKREAGRAYRGLCWVERHSPLLGPRPTVPLGRLVIRGREGSRPSARRTRSRRLP